MTNPAAPPRSTASRIVPLVPIVLAIATAGTAGYFATSCAPRDTMSHGMAMDHTANASQATGAGMGGVPRIDREVEAPKFLLPLANEPAEFPKAGGKLALKDALARVNAGGGGSVLIIYIMNFGCGHCRAALDNYSGIKSTLDKYHVQVLVVSPEPVEQLKQAAQDDPDFPFPLLADADYTFADAYGLRFGDNLLHGTFIIRPDGQIQFAMQSSGVYDNYDAVVSMCKGMWDNR